MNWKRETGLLFIFIQALIVLFLIPAHRVEAQQPVPTPSDDEVNAIASQLYCPVCQNIPLDVCPTTACHQWRELIRQMLSEGKSAAEIKQYFLTYYGAGVLSEPPRSGLNWLVYVVPPAAFLIGLLLLLMAFRTWKNNSNNPAHDLGPVEPGGDHPAEAPLDVDPYIARLEAELKKRK